jgi:lipopolysaccharide biosynthesis glycosyltransferase
LYNKIEFLPIDITKEFAGFEQKEDCWPISIYGRFLIPRLKPNLKKIIYLDCDIILLGDIKEFYEQDLKGKTFGVCFDNWHINKNYLKSAMEKAQVRDMSYEYFNSGSMLIDCRKIDVKKLFDIEKQIRDTLDGDQCVLNKYCYEYDASINLDLKFNSSSLLCYLAKNGFPKETQEMYDYYGIKIKPDFKPLIRHFGGNKKPWNASYERTHHIGYHISNFLDWWYYCSMTDFYEECKTRFENKNKDIKIEEKTVSSYKIKIKLFGVIPFLKIKRKVDKIKIYLFNIILILKMKVKR